MRFEIKHMFLGKVLFYLDTTSLKLCVEAAVSTDAYLRGAYLRGAKGLGMLPYQLQTCPRSGSFEAWKKGASGHIIKLHIPWFARRTACVQSRKCRTELAYVKAIYDENGKPVSSCRGWCKSNLEYRAGKFAKPDSYDASWTTECSNGIHFFMTKQEAEEWI